MLRSVGNPDPLSLASTNPANRAFGTGPFESRQTIQDGEAVIAVALIALMLAPVSSAQRQILLGGPVSRKPKLPLANSHPRQKLSLEPLRGTLPRADPVSLHPGPMLIGRAPTD